MAGIRIHREHEAGTREAKRRVTRIAKGIADRFEVDTEWDGDVLFFRAQRRQWAHCRRR